MSLTGWIGMLSALLTTTAFLPQVIKAYQSGNTQALSYVMLFLQILGNGLWVVYGQMIGSTSIVMANMVTFVLVAILILLKYRHHRQKKSGPLRRRL